LRTLCNLNLNFNGTIKVPFNKIKKNGKIKINIIFSTQINYFTTGTLLEQFIYPIIEKRKKKYKSIFVVNKLENVNKNLKNKKLQKIENILKEIKLEYLKV
jgi:ABC-type uncharacterized transport system fused permease/ATPase subunit